MKVVNEDKALRKNLLKPVKESKFRLDFTRFPGSLNVGK